MIAPPDRQLTLLVGTVLLLGSAVSARADYNFNFNSLSPSPTQSDQSSNPGGTNAIALYMDSVLSCAGCVTVSGLNSSGIGYLSGSTVGYGVAVDQTYTGDGHVVGPGGASLTLGNSNGATSNSSTTPGAYDSFISNTADPEGTNGPKQLSQGILITFSHGVSLTGTFSFDFEIFPDASCPSSCGTPPDLVFSANGATPYSHTWSGLVPSGTLPNGNGDGISTKSPMMMGGETAPQYIGVSMPITLTNATSLSFMDWPATIGVDNLKLVTTPEPKGEVFLLGMLALVAIAGTKLRRASAKS
jgi:hypothetical protein